MKKILFTILIVLLLVLCGLTAWNGISIGAININGYKQIQQKSNELDRTIAKATMLASTDYENAVSDMQKSIKKLEEEKKTYNELVSVSDSDEVKNANQYQKYEIEYLWTIIGNHATSEGVVLKIDVLAGIGENTYNLNFTANGSYVGISEFISDIENDSNLGFKIENFSMVPGSSTSDLQATFTCRDIEIKDISKADISTNEDNKEDKTNQTENATNTTNTVNTVENQNTTNQTNTSNTTNQTTEINTIN